MYFSTSAVNANQLKSVVNNCNFKCFQVKRKALRSPFVIPAFGRQMQENQEFKAIPSYIVSLRPAWAILDPASKT